MSNKPTDSKWQREVSAKLDLILDVLRVQRTQLKAIRAKEKRMAGDLVTITAAVKRNTEVDASALALITGLATSIADLKNDPVALQALSDELTAKSQELADAVAANTPAAPAGHKKK